MDFNDTNYLQNLWNYLKTEILILNNNSTLKICPWISKYENSLHFYCKNPEALEFFPLFYTFIKIIFENYFQSFGRFNHFFIKQCIESLDKGIQIYDLKSYSASNAN